MFEKARIRAYLSSKEEKRAFDRLIADFADSEAKRRLKEMGFKQIKIELDWGEYCKRITISAKNENGLYLFATANTKNEHFLSLGFDEEPCLKRITPPKNAQDAEYFYNEIKMQIKTFEYLD